MLGLSTLNVTVQMSAPRWVVARALALYQLAAFGGMALGSWLWGVTAEREGLTLALASAGLVQLACAALGLRFPLPSTHGLNLDPAGGWTEPSLPAQITPRSRRWRSRSSTRFPSSIRARSCASWPSAASRGVVTALGAGPC